MANVENVFALRRTDDYRPSGISPDTLEHRAPAVATSLSILSLPRRLGDSCLPDGVRQAGNEHVIPDLVILSEDNAARLLTSRLPPAVAAIVPIVNVSRSGGTGPASANARRADLSIETASRACIAEAAIMLQPAIGRMRLLPARIWASHDPREHLLARLAVRARGTEPLRDPSVSETVIYPDSAAVPDALGRAEELVELGLLTRHFFDVLATCPRCASARLSLRERCEACGSTNLVEEAIIHHLRCCAQAPEHEFRQGTALVCPKCRMHLESFGLDYDRPGNLMFCRACGHASADAPVGFVCLDCRAQGQGSALGKRMIWAHAITEAGLAQVRSGMPLPDSRQDVVVSRLAAFAEREIAAKRPFCALAAQLNETEACISGGRMWEQTHILFGILLRETFTPETEIVDAAPLFLALLGGDEESDVKQALPQIRAELERHLAAPPRIKYAVFGPREIATILGRASQASR
jgi:hypothetical protein